MTCPQCWRNNKNRTIWFCYTKCSSLWTQRDCEKLTRIRPVVVCPEMSSPAQSFASVTHPTSAFAADLSSDADRPSTDLVVTVTTLCWQKSHERMRHERTRSNPLKNVMRLEQRNAYQCGSRIHSWSASDQLYSAGPRYRARTPATRAAATGPPKSSSTMLHELSRLHPSDKSADVPLRKSVRGAWKTTVFNNNNNNNNNAEDG